MIVRSPEYFDDNEFLHPEYKSLFLAGGITKVRDWQMDMCGLLANLPKLMIYNPRRETAPEEVGQQILWEWKALKKVHAISFWFSLETLQPITLLELGRWTAFTEPKLELDNGVIRLKMNRKKLFVGIHPDYKRKLDVEIQLKFQCPDQKIVYTLEGLAAQIREWCNAGNGSV